MTNKLAFEIVGIIGIFVIGYYAFISINSLNGEISSVDQKLDDLNTKVFFLSNILAPSPEPLIYGDPQLKDTTSKNISISFPINGSFINDTFSINGKAKLGEHDKIYIVSKIQNKYWMLMDGISDQLGNWKGAKNCSIPVSDRSDCDTYDIFAIVAKESYGIGSYSDTIPNCLAKSNPLYAKVCPTRWN